MTRKKIFIIFAMLALCLTCCFALTACKKCKHANTHEQTVTQADCDSAGSVNIICDDCGATVETKTVNALGHTYGDWNVTLSPTVYADGEMQRVCGRNAKHIESKPIPKLEQGGDYTVTVTEQPDCTKKGKLTYQSSVYGTYEVDIPAELHTYDDEREGYCKVCGNKYYSVGLDYELSADGQYYTVKLGSCEENSIAIPHSYKNLPVKAIGSEAFAYRTWIKSIVIPEYVETIGSGAFNGSGITKVTFNAINCADFNQKNWVFLVNTKVELTIGCRVERIPARMFYPLVTQDRTVNLAKITFEDDSVCRSIGDSAFNKTSVGSLILPDSLETIGANAFYNTDITALVLGNNVTSIGSSAFGACGRLVSVTFGRALSKIGDDAFNYCSKLVSVDLSKTRVKSIGDDAFKGCSAVQFVNLPDTLESIGKQAFVDCSAMTALNLGNGVKTIGEQAFANCVKLTSLTVPASVTSIANSAFANAETLAQIEFNAVNCADFQSGNNVFANAAKDVDLTVTFGDTVKHIPARLFYATSDASKIASIKTLTLGKNVSSIGDYAFFGVQITQASFGGSSETWRQVTIGSGNSALISLVK